jgi:hypothetical protein
MELFDFHEAAELLPEFNELLHKESLKYLPLTLKGL